MRTLDLQVTLSAMRGCKTEEDRNCKYNPAGAAIGTGHKPTSFLSVSIDPMWEMPKKLQTAFERARPGTQEAVEATLKPP